MSKKNIILGGILLVLILISYLYNSPYKNWRENRNQGKNFFAGIDLQAVNAIKIKRADQETILKKIGDKWKVDGTKDFYLDDSVAESVKTSLEAAQKSVFEIVGNNQEKKKDFKTDNSGVEVKLSLDDKELLTFIIGDTGLNYQDTYISQSNVNQTFAVKAFLASAFDRDDWRGKKIFKTDKEKISKIRFQYPDREFTINRGEKKKDSEDYVWNGTLPYNFEVSTEKVNQVFDILTDLSAIEIPQQTFAGTGLEKSAIIVQVAGDGVDNILMIGNKDKDDNYFAKRGDSDNIYLITKEQKEVLDKKIEGMK